MIDLHCHVLPGIDDGPETLDEALALARVAVGNGLKAIVATPHASWDYPGTSPAVVEAAVAGLSAALRQEGIALPIFRGAEVAITRAVDLDDEQLTGLRLGGRRGTHLLVECPLAAQFAGLEDHVLRLRERGHRIVLAHPERCPTFQRSPEAYERLVGLGMLGQVTAGSLVGRFGRQVQAYALELVRSGLVHVVASDAHSADRRRPSLLEELTEAGLGEQARWLTHEVPWAVLAGRPVPDAPRMPTSKELGGRRRAGLLRRA